MKTLKATPIVDFCIEREIKLHNGIAKISHRFEYGEEIDFLVGSGQNQMVRCGRGDAVVDLLYDEFLILFKII